MNTASTTDPALPTRGLPSRLHNAALERLVLPAGDAVLRTEFMRELRRWRRIQHLDADALARLQRSGLVSLLEHATAEVPYYRGLNISRDGDPYEWLRRFPILTKQHLRADGDRILTPGATNLVKISSSGSSGVQSTLWSTPREISRSQAIQTLWWEWAGYRLGDRLLQTGMTPDRGITKRIKDRLLRTSYVVAFGLTQAEMQDIVRRGANRPWRHIGGYASSIDALARAAIDMPEVSLRPVSAISWGDKLYPAHRQHVAQAFDAPVLDTYGTAEGFMIASQRFNEPYYVMSPHVVVELLDGDDQPVPDGEIGHVVVTRLDAPAMPMIRFRLGDLAIAPAKPVQVAGGPAFPQLERIVGRETDIWISPGGRTLTVHTFTGVMEHFDQIEQFAVVPATGRLTMEYIAGEDFDPGVLEQAAQALCAAVGEKLVLDWKRVTHIPDSPSGKPQIIRSG